MSLLDQLSGRRKSKKLEDKDYTYFKWLKWVQKLVKRKGIDADVDICAYGRTQLVSNPKKIGAGWMFWSKGCSGCEISSIGLKAVQSIAHAGPTAPKPILPKGAPNCAFLKSPLFVMQEVKEGDVIQLRTPSRLPNKDSLKRGAKAQEFVRAIPAQERQERRRNRPPRLVQRPRDVNAVPQPFAVPQPGGRGGPVPPQPPFGGNVPPQVPEAEDRLNNFLVGGVFDNNDDVAVNFRRLEEEVNLILDDD